MRDAQELRIDQEVSIELDLPGQGSFTVLAVVAHVTDRGAGLQIKSGPPGFKEALAAYLLRLGRRSGVTVFVDLEPWREAIAEAGYRVAPIPPTHVLCSGADRVGVVATPEHARQCSAALAFLERDSSAVIPVHPKLPVDAVLRWLDERLLG